MHPLKALSLFAWTGLCLAQLSLLLPAFAIDYYWVLLLTLPLFLPLPGLLRSKRYTYRWVGFMTLIYLCVGISELVANPALRLYGVTTTLCSIGLFLASIYYARYLASRPASQADLRRRQGPA